MKIRTGFVSNSSSSSFLLVGYQAEKKVLSPSDYREMVEKKYSAKVIKKYALDYFTQDDNVYVDNFDSFPALFWKEMWKEKKSGTNRNDRDEQSSGDEYDVPAGLKLLSGNEEENFTVDEGFVGISLGREYGQSIEVPGATMIETINKVKQLAPPGTEVFVVAGEVGDY